MNVLPQSSHSKYANEETCLDTFEWDVNEESLNISTKIIEASFGNYSVIWVEFQMTRVPNFHLYVSIIPMIVIILTSLFTGRIVPVQKITVGLLLVSQSIMLTFFANYFVKGGQPPMLTVIFIYSYSFSALQSFFVLMFQKHLDQINQNWFKEFLFPNYNSNPVQSQLSPLANNKYHKCNKCHNCLVWAYFILDFLDFISCTVLIIVANRIIWWEMVELPEPVRIALFLVISALLIIYGLPTVCGSIVYGLWIRYLSGRSPNGSPKNHQKVDTKGTETDVSSKGRECYHTRELE